MKFEGIHNEAARCLDIECCPPEIYPEEKWKAGFPYLNPRIPPSSSYISPSLPPCVITWLFGNNQKRINERERMNSYNWKEKSFWWRGRKGGGRCAAAQHCFHLLLLGIEYNSRKNQYFFIWIFYWKCYKWFCFYTDYKCP